jgi:hypothetical protein
MAYLRDGFTPAHGGRDAGVSGRCAEDFDEVERAALIKFLADNPETGDLMQGTGGARKLRSEAKVKGKRSGARPDARGLVVEYERGAC